MTRHATAEDLSAYVDQELEPARLRLVKEHLVECDDCRERADGMRSLVRDLRRLERLEPPPTLGTRLHRRIVLQPRPKSLLEGLESRLGGISLQPSVGFTFALVFAFAAILYLFAGSIERHERLRIPVLRPYPPPAIELAVHELDGRSFLREGQTWREEGLKPSGNPQELMASDDRTLALVGEHPGLGAWLAEGYSVELEIDGEYLRLLPGASSD